MPGLFSYESAVLARKALVVAIGSLIKDAYLQLLSAVVLMVLALWIAATAAPFEEPHFNTLESLSIAVVIATQLISLMYLRVDSVATPCTAGLAPDTILNSAGLTCREALIEKEKNDVIVTALLIIINGLLIIYLVLNLLRALLQGPVNDSASDNWRGRLGCLWRVLARMCCVKPGEATASSSNVPLAALIERQLARRRERKELRQLRLRASLSKKREGKGSKKGIDTGDTDATKVTAGLGGSQSSLLTLSGSGPAVPLSSSPPASLVRVVRANASAGGAGASGSKASAGGFGGPSGPSMLPGSAGEPDAAATDMDAAPAPASIGPKGTAGRVRAVAANAAPGAAGATGGGKRNSYAAAMAGLVSVGSAMAAPGRLGSLASPTDDTARNPLAAGVAQQSAQQILQAMAQASATGSHSSGGVTLAIANPLRSQSRGAAGVAAAVAAGAAAAASAGGAGPGMAGGDSSSAAAPQLTGSAAAAAKGAIGRRSIHAGLRKRVVVLSSAAAGAGDAKGAAAPNGGVGSGTRGRAGSDDDDDDDDSAAIGIATAVVVAPSPVHEPIAPSASAAAATLGLSLGAPALSRAAERKSSSEKTAPGLGALDLSRTASFSEAAKTSAAAAAVGDGGSAGAASSLGSSHPAVATLSSFRTDSGSTERERDLDRPSSFGLSRSSMATSRRNLLTASAVSRRNILAVLAADDAANAPSPPLATPPSMAASTAAAPTVLPLAAAAPASVAAAAPAEADSPKMSVPRAAPLPSASEPRADKFSTAIEPPGGKSSAPAQARADSERVGVDMRSSAETLEDRVSAVASDKPGLAASSIAEKRSPPAGDSLFGKHVAAAPTVGATVITGPAATAAAAEATAAPAAPVSTAQSLELLAAASQLFSAAATASSAAAGPTANQPPTQQRLEPIPAAGAGSAPSVSAAAAAVQARPAAHDEADSPASDTDDDAW